LNSAELPGQHPGLKNVRKSATAGAAAVLQPDTFLHILVFLFREVNHRIYDGDTGRSRLKSLLSIFTSLVKMYPLGFGVLMNLDTCREIPGNATLL
jgi:hypothetical protein